MKQKLFRRTMAGVLSAAMVLTAMPAMSLGAVDTAAQTEASKSSTRIVGLKTEGVESPLGVDVANPVFSWRMESEAIGVLQQSYRIVVKDAAGKTVWDSQRVESGKSVDIRYAGEALKPQSAYSWQVTVEDNYGNTKVSEPARFETSLLSPELSAWGGAKWIGADELSLDAQGQNQFDISTKVQIPAGSKGGSLIFGGNDFRLMKKEYNVYGVAGENYIRVELDVSGVGTEKGAVVNVYKVGYGGKSEAEPVYTAKLEAITQENVNEVHTLRAEVSNSTLELTLDGKKITPEGGGGFGAPAGGVSLDDQGMAYPHLASIGFAVEAGQKIIFSDYELNNVSFGQGKLFGQNIGATYSIWDGIEGVAVDGKTITVDGANAAVKAYADPSYASEPYLRKDFTLEGDVESARLYVSYQGIGDFYINGQEVAPEEWFKQGSMEYREEIGYNVYDVTDLLTDGANAMGAVMGEGWWTGHMATFNPQMNYYGDQEALLARLDVKYRGGETTVITTDETWKYYGDGPVRFASLFQGERYDATKEAAIANFSKTGYNDSGWKAAAAVQTRNVFADQDLVVRYDENVHVIRTLNTTSLGENGTGSGAYIYDAGENVAAVPQITIPADYAKEGETITIRYSEILYPELEEYEGLEGNLLQENYRTALTTDFYTMKAGEQTFIPDLTFHGYRYIEISGLDRPLPAENVKSLALSSIDNTATYNSSNADVNRLFKNGQNSAASNYITVPTDCPQRDERMGWMGDANVYILAGSYNADLYQFMRQWMRCVVETQGENGMTAQFSPNYPSYDLEKGTVNVGGMAFGITWNSAIVFIPYYLYQQYGDTTIIHENMDAIYKYMECLAASPLKVNEETTPLTSQTGFLCDHLSVVSTDGTMLGNSQYVYALEAVADMAEAIGQTEKAEKYRQMYETAKDCWNRLYIDPETGRTRDGAGKEIHTQASYASPLNYGVVKDEYAAKFVENYVDTIEHPVNEGKALTPYTITTGFNATPNVLNALTKHGRADVAYKMLECTEYASWLYPVKQGATSIWERWNSYTIENGFGGNNSMNSFNHYSLGAVTSWMMDTQLGIQYDAANPGYKHFVLQPVAGGSFTSAEGSFASAYGRIQSGWTAKNGQMTSYQAVVPANTTATLYLQLTENQAEALTLPEGVAYAGMEEHNGVSCAKFELGSGSYDLDLLDAIVAGASKDLAEAQKEAEEAKKELEKAKEEAAQLQEKADQAEAARKEAQEKADRAEAARKEAAKKAQTDASARADAEAKAKAAEKAKAEAEAARVTAEAAKKAAQDAAAKAKAAQEKAENSLEKARFQAQKPSLKNAKSGKKQQIVVTWKKVGSAKGYQIQYGTKSNFKGAKKVTVKKGGATKTTLKKLKSGKKYYIRMRAYKTIGGKKVYSGYSVKKSVKVR